MQLDNQHTTSVKIEMPKFTTRNTLNFQKGRGTKSLPAFNLRIELKKEGDA